jgi:hypothetical protein
VKLPSVCRLLLSSHRLRPFLRVGGRGYLLSAGGRSPSSAPAAVASSLELAVGRFSPVGYLFPAAPRGRPFSCTCRCSLLSCISRDSCCNSIALPLNQFRLWPMRFGFRGLWRKLGLALASADNGCAPLRNLPCRGHCCGLQIFFVSQVKT